MEVKAKNYKNWCIENISPQSWTRITLKSLDAIRAAGYSLKDFENPGDDLIMNDMVLEAFNAKLLDLYQVTIEEGVLT